MGGTTFEAHHRHGIVELTALASSMILVHARVVLWDCVPSRPLGQVGRQRGRLKIPILGITDLRYWRNDLVDWSSR